ncbi:MAG: cysteate synthase [Alphaproteobacteria bacterium]|uniref:Cysteate synthase n=1 Tax=Candidatus Nitrobium versatile TaxID=2884831 RepID=A0A953J2T6_9BACT|nr:cysteate synthase [Candidatus Nitrobium versatile]
MSHYTLHCSRCDTVLENVSFSASGHCKDALLETRYRDKRFSESDAQGIWKFNWLPVHTPDFPQPGPVVYPSARLAQRLGLSRLHIAFNGYWPEKGAELRTCTFKEFEAAVVIQNAKENGVPGLTVASAGNTARAFSHLSHVSGFPVIIVVPRMCIMEMWYLEERARIPTLVVGDGDYSDSIDVAKRVSRIAGMPFEGGVQNVAKRDGLGSVLLEAVARMGRLPDHYFQAIGSGTGAIGVAEMAGRFVRDGRFGSRLPRLHLAQNLPFAPMVKAWQQKSRTLFSEDLRPELIAEITTRVLSNRYPAYSVQGGIYDALEAAGGEMYGIPNKEVFAAMELFQETEGVDIVPAAGVAVAALIRGVLAHTVGKDEVILLNITGGGEKKYTREHKIRAVEPYFVPKNISDKEIEEVICSLLKKNS